jgi:probable phosphoglycerate mutase
MSITVIRQGETTWCLSGRHTGTTDIRLTDNGRRAAVGLRTALAGQNFERVLTSPMQRARETCDIAGLGAQATVEPDLAGWDYGDYEGKTSDEIRETAPGWQIFHDGAPGGETPADIESRADHVIARMRAIDGDVALFAHGHFLRVLAARWIRLPARAGENLLLDPATLCVLDFYRDVPAIRIWNGPAAASQAS